MKNQQDLTIHDILIRRKTKEFCPIINIIDNANRKLYIFPGFAVEARCLEKMFEKETNCFYTAESNYA